MSQPPSADAERASAALPSILERILERTRCDVQRRKQQHPLDTLRRETAGRPVRSLTAALEEQPVAVIAEFKRRSPSAGSLAENPDLERVVEAYQRGGASAISVLTDEPHFGGSLEDLCLARRACSLPLLRKDFIVDSYQLHEARWAGADAVLLIVAALQPQTLEALHEQAVELGLEVLVEVHNHRELGIALNVGSRLIGINNRDLHDFSVDVERTFALLPEVPDDVKIISESGISTAAQLRRLGEHGVRGVLVGERLMRSGDPERALRDLRGKA